MFFPKLRENKKNLIWEIFFLKYNPPPVTVQCINILLSQVLIQFGNAEISCDNIYLKSNNGNLRYNKKEYSAFQN